MDPISVIIDVSVGQCGVTTSIEICCWQRILGERWRTYMCGRTRGSTHREILLESIDGLIDRMSILLTFLGELHYQCAYVLTDTTLYRGHMGADFNQL